jgi:hypothetical protein
MLRALGGLAAAFAALTWAQPADAQWRTGTGAVIDPLNVIADDLEAEALRSYAGHLQARPGAMRTGEIVIVDFRKRSDERRLYIVDMTTGAVQAEYVSHGKGSDPGHTRIAARFSDVMSTGMSSVGAYVGLNRYRGKHGASLRIEGLDPSNDNAYARAIVFHTAGYFQPALGLFGRSFGCFVVEPAVMERVYRAVESGGFLYAGPLSLYDPSIRLDPRNPGFDEELLEADVPPAPAPEVPMTVAAAPVVPPPEPPVVLASSVTIGQKPRRLPSPPAPAIVVAALAEIPSPPRLPIDVPVIAASASLPDIYAIPTAKPALQALAAIAPAKAVPAPAAAVEAPVRAVGSFVPARKPAALASAETASVPVLTASAAVSPIAVPAARGLRGAIEAEIAPRTMAGPIGLRGAWTIPTPKPAFGEDPVPAAAQPAQVGRVSAAQHSAGQGSVPAAKPASIARDRQG